MIPPLFIALCIIGSLTLRVGARNPQVKVGTTNVIGKNLGPAFQQDFFGGIPFAEPPVGELRIQPPVLKTCLDVPEFDATNYGKACLQRGGTLDTLSEDCLTINVLRPSGIKNNAKLPVVSSFSFSIFFWTYGGGFYEGRASDKNASAIVARSVERGTPLIYVSFNYRLGPLGFPQGQEAQDRGALNLALRDQIAALEWVQANVENFGGDKHKVTVFGVSAGSIMTAILYLNPSFGRLARAAIFHSGQAATAFIHNATRREVDWQNFVASVPSCKHLAFSNGKADTFDCLRSVPTTNSTTGVVSTEILDAVDNALNASPEEFGFDPTYDGTAFDGGVYPDLPSRIFSTGRYSKVPFMAGTSMDDGTLFTVQLPSFSPQAMFSQIVANYSPPVTSLGSIGTSVLENRVRGLVNLYSDDPAQGSPYGTGNDVFGLPPAIGAGYKKMASILGDLLFQSQRRGVIQQVTKQGVKAYAFMFSEKLPDQVVPLLGVMHGSDYPLIYGSFEAVNYPPAPPGSLPFDVSLSQIMMDYWISFATSKDSNPNAGLGVKRPVWQVYTSGNEAVLELKRGNVTMIPDDYRKEQIDYINAVPEIFHH